MIHSTFFPSKANEPRCRGSTAATSGTCTPATITKWATTMGAFIKSVDSNHLVALGDEGFYNQPGAASYPYQCVLVVSLLARRGSHVLILGVARASTLTPTSKSRAWTLAPFTYVLVSFPLNTANRFLTGYGYSDVPCTCFACCLSLFRFTQTECVYL